MLKVVRAHAKLMQFFRNRYYRMRLTNKTPSLICNNCAGGLLYNYLGLAFRSPFIKSYITNSDFLDALENFDEFLKSEIIEDTNAKEPYPVGFALERIRIQFVHYKTFEEAVEKWEIRKARIDVNNMAIMITNFEENNEILERFEKLPFPNKVVFSEKPHPEYPFVVYLKGYKEFKVKMTNMGDCAQVWYTKNYFTGKRFIDEFDYVSFLNSLQQ